jgi:hypothetical protein
VKPWVQTTPQFHKKNKIFAHFFLVPETYSFRTVKVKDSLTVVTNPLKPYLSFLIRGVLETP